MGCLVIHIFCLNITIIFQRRIEISEDNGEEEANQEFNEVAQEREGEPYEVEESFNEPPEDVDELAKEYEKDFGEEFDVDELAKEYEKDFGEEFDVDELAKEYEKDFGEEFDVDELAKEYEKDFGEEFDVDELVKEYEKDFEDLQEYENIDSQSMVQVHETSEMQEESQEYDEDQLENDEEIELDPEEYEQNHDPIHDPDEIEFIRDVEELARTMREYTETSDGSKEDIKECDNAGFKAEQAYNESREIEQNQEQKEAYQEVEEKEKELTKEESTEQTVEDLSIQDQQEDFEEIEEEFTEIEQEEFEYLWEKYAEYDREGRNAEGIAELMHEAEEAYEVLKKAEEVYNQQEKENLKSINQEEEEDLEEYKKEIETKEGLEYFVEAEEKLYAEGKSSQEIAKEMQKVENVYEIKEEVEKIYEQQEKDKLKLVDHEEEEDLEDERDEIDRRDAIEFLIEIEEELLQREKSQEEIDEQMEKITNDYFQNEQEKNQQIEQEKEIIKEIKNVPKEIDEKNSEIEEQKKIEQALTHYDERAIEVNLDAEEVLDEIESDLEDNVKNDYPEERINGSLKESEGEDLEIDEYEKLMQLYRQETGKRPIYAGKYTKGFYKWLEQHKARKEEVKEQKEKEKIKEKWKKILLEWIEQSEMGLVDPDFKLLLVELLQKAEILEELVIKCVSKKVPEKEQEHWRALLKTLQRKYPIHLELYWNIREFKKFVKKAHPWDIPHVKFKFLRHLEEKYKNLKDIQEIIKKVKNFSNRKTLRFKSKTRLIMCKRIYDLIISDYSKEDILINLIYGIIRGSSWTSEVSYIEFKNLIKKVKNPESRNRIIRYFYELAEIVLFIHKISQSDENLNMKRLSEKLIKKGYNLRLKVDSLRFFIKDLVEFLKNEFDKFKVNEIKKQDLFDDGKYKECANCHKLKLHSDYIKRKCGGIESICKNCKQEKEAIRRELNKLNIIKEIDQVNFIGKCQKCKTDISKLPALDFHHPTSHKTISWRNLRHSNYKSTLKRLEKESVEILCANCHSKEQSSIFNRFKHIILKSDLFKYSAKEIRILILNTLKETFPKKTPEARSKIKYNIMTWIKKRYIIERLYDGRCITCRKVTVFNNLPSLIFHHLDTNKKEKNIWRRIQTKSIKDIISILRKEKCICVCSNCHRLLHTPYFLSDIINHLENEKRINAISFYESMNKKIKNFNFKEGIFKDPLKLKYKYGMKWKEYLEIIYKYCQNKNDFHFDSLDLKKILKVSLDTININLKTLLNQNLIEISSEKKPLKKGKFIIGQIPRLYTLTPLGIKSAQESL